MDDGTFKIGEIAVFRNLPMPFSNFNSQECEVVGALEMRHVVDMFGAEGMLATYLVSFQGRDVATGPLFLKKRFQKPDSKDAERNTPVSWDDCPWMPELEAA